MHCTACGERLDARARFCHHCGARVMIRPDAPMPGTGRGAAGVAVLPRQELAASVGARQELGEHLEREVIDAFLARVGQAIDARVDARVQGQVPRGRQERRDDPGGIAIGICSLVFGIPLTGVAAVFGGLPGMIGAWSMIALINVAYHQRRTD